MPNDSICTLCAVDFYLLPNEGIVMARIIENRHGRRMIKMSVDDIISVVREYQRIVKRPKKYNTIRLLLGEAEMYLPEEL